MSSTEADLIPGAVLNSDLMPGHWLLARLGKKVLRPGGRELTDKLLASLAIDWSDHVVELAPGLGSTTEMVLACNPASYLGVDRDPDAARRISATMTRPHWSVVQASATNTGQGTNSTDVAFGEAYLTMQPNSLKVRVATELARIVRPGGQVGLHEVALSPADIDQATCERISRDLAGTIKVPVRPLTIAGWRGLLEGAGFSIDAQYTAPLHLLEARRLIADEGVISAARFVSRVARESDARTRVAAMRSAMRRNADHLQALVLVATRCVDD